MRVVYIIYEIASSPDDGEACLSLAGNILSNWLDGVQHEMTWSHELECTAITRYVQTISTKSYYLYFAELVSLCKGMKTNKIVAHRFEDRYAQNSFRKTCF